MKQEIRELEVTIGRNVRQVRKRLGMSKEHLALSAGIKSANIVTRIENGRKALNIEMLYRLSAALKVTPADLIGGGKIHTTRETLLREFLFIIEDPIDPELYRYVETTVKLTASRKRALKKIDDLFEQLKNNHEMEETTRGSVL